MRVLQIKPRHDPRINPLCAMLTLTLIQQTPCDIVSNSADPLLSGTFSGCEAGPRRGSVLKTPYF